MANNEININIKATDNATPTIKTVEDAITNLGKNANVSFSISGIENINKQIAKGFSSKIDIIDIDTLEKTSQTIDSFNKKFNKPLKIIDVDNISPVVPIIENITKKTDNLKNTIAKSSLELDNLGSRFRYLSLVTGIISASAVMMTKSWVDSASKMEQSYIKLSAYAKIYNSDLTKMDKLASEMTEFGVSKDEAATVVANITAMGLGAEKTEKLIRGMMDTAIISKENLNDTFGQALVKSSQGFRAYLERQIDAVGVNTDLNRVMIEQAHALGKTKEQLTQNEKYIIEYDYYMKEFNKNSGAASGASQTFSGTLSRMSARINEAKVALGNSLVPLMGTLAEGLINASTALRDFVNEHPAFSSAVITGTIAVTGFITVFASIGALAPMVVSGLNITRNALMMMINTTSLVALKFTALALAIGGAVYLILKVTGQWDKWSKAIKNVASQMANAINPINEVGKVATEVADSVKKSFDSLKDNILYFIRDTRQDMTQWVADHDKNIKEVGDQINDLASDYKSAIKKINDEYDKSTKDMSLSHQRKVEDIQEQLDEEISKGIWADQTKIKELKKELARENEDYAISSQDKLDTKEEQTKKEVDQYSEKYEKLKEELDKETKLYTDHATEIANIRAWDLTPLDEFQQKQQDVNDRIVAFNKEINDLNKEVSDNANNASVSLGKVGEDAKNATEGVKNVSFGTSIGDAIGGMSDWLYKQMEEIGIFSWNKFWDNFEAGWPSAKKNWIDFWDEVTKNFKDAFEALGGGDWYQGVLFSLGILTTALLGIELYLKLRLPAAFVSFAASSTVLSRVGALFSPLNLALLAVVVAIQLITWQYGLLKGEVDEANKSFDNENNLLDRRLEQAKKNYEQGKITKEQYNEIVKSINNEKKALEENREELKKNTDIFGSWSVFWDNFKVGLSGIGNWLKDNVWTPFVDLFSKLVIWFVENLTWFKLFKMLLNIGTWFSANIIIPFFTALGIWLGKVVKWFSDNFTWSNFLKTLTNIGTWFSTNIGTPFSSWFTSVKEWFKNNFTWDNLLSGLSSLSDWIKDKTSSITSGASTTKTSNSSSSGTTKSSNSSSSGTTSSSGFSSYLSNAVSSAFSSKYKDITEYSDGGVIPGKTGEETLIRAHAGETVLPIDYEQKKTTSTNNTFNISINNPSVRSDADIKSIAQAVKDVISREMALKRFA